MTVIRTTRIKVIAIYLRRLSKLAWASFLVVFSVNYLGGCADPTPTSLSDEEIAAHNQAVGLMGQFNYHDAHAVLENLLRRHPDHAELQVDLAIATLNRQQEGDENAATAILEKVLEKDPAHLRARYTAGLLQLHAGQAAPAAEHFKRVAEDDPADAFAAYHLALSLAQQSRFEDALTWYRQAIAADPYLRSGYYGTFQSLRQLGRSDKAREMLDIYQKLAINPRAHQAEFKYTQMGPKAEVRPLENQPKQALTAPKGPLFAEAQSLPPSSAQRASPNMRPGLSAADIDGDGDLDLFATGVATDTGRPNAVYLQNAQGGFDLQPTHPLTGVGLVNATLWGDIDNDGLLDAYLCRRGPNQLWRQIAPGRWEDVTAATETANGESNSVDGALFDADHDGDLDIFVVNNNGPNELLNNNRDGSFTPLAAKRNIAGSGSGSRQVLITDLDGDRDSDLIVIYDNPPHEVYRNDLLWTYVSAPGFDALREASLASILAEDRDADGQPELYSLDENDQLTRWRLETDGLWRPSILEKKPEPAREHEENTLSEAFLALVDLDGDGQSELVKSSPTGWAVYRFEGDQLQVLDNQSHPGLGHWIPFQSNAGAGPAVVGVNQDAALTIWQPGRGRLGFLSLSFSGMEEKGKSMRSNASGVGTRVGIRTGSRWIVREAFRNYSGPGQSLQPIAVGLGGAKRADFVSIDWTDGVFQSELNLEGGERHDITETQRQLSSCPVLFAWDGAGYRFVSDFLGVGGMGYAVGPGEYAEPRPWENFQLPAGLPVANDDRYRLKLTQPMEEAAYLDAARLVVYDLPPGWQMVLDERMAINAPEPTGKPRYFRRERLPDRAVNQDGADVTGSVREADLRAAPTTPLDERFIGRLRSTHALELRFDHPLDQGPGEPMLVIDGWVEYPYSQTMFAAWQARAVYEAPSLDAWSADTGWRVVLEEFGYPAGMPRRMSVPLPALPPGTTRMRLRTNMEIYWDRIALAYAEDPGTSVRRSELPLLEARTETTGFPLRTTGEQRLPRFDYGRRSPFWDTRHMAGFYTAFGPVEPLLSDVDDALAIIGPGEGIHLEFASPDTPVGTGWTRTLVLETRGWAKDMDLFTRDGDTLEPLPTTGKPAERRDRLHAMYNTRFRAGR